MFIVFCYEGLTRSYLLFISINHHLSLAHIRVLTIGVAAFFMGAGALYWSGAGCSYIGGASKTGMGGASITNGVDFKGVDACLTGAVFGLVGAAGFLGAA